MEALQELVKLVTQKRVKKIELFDESSRNKSSNYFKLFEGIHAQKYQTDDEAASDIYQCAASEKKYLILKTRLKQKLLNTLFFLDVQPSESISEFQAISYEMRKNLFQAQILLLNDMSEVGVILLEKLLKRVQELQISEIEWQAAEMLRQHYAQEGKHKMFAYYQEITEIAKERALAEKEAQEIYESLWVNYQRSRSQKGSLVEIAKNAYSNVQKITQRYQTKFLQYYQLKVKSLLHRIHDEHNETLSTIEEQMDYFNRNPIFRSSNQLEFLCIDKANVYLHQRNFEEGEDFAQKQTILVMGTEKWFVFQENRFLLAMHSSNFLRAGEIFQQVVAHNNFRLLSEAQKERWYHFQAFLHYIYKSDKMKELRTLTQNSKIPFKLSDYLMIQPNFSKSQAGLQTAILTAQILFFLERNDVDESAKRIELLQQYTRSYPKKDAHFRRESFVKMLKEMYQQDFRFFQTRQNTEKDFFDLTNTPFDYRGTDQFLEIMPYEIIWQRILEKIKQYRYG